MTETHRIRTSSQRVSEGHRLVTLRGSNRTLKLDIFDHETPIRAEGFLVQQKGKSHIPGITEALYKTAREILLAISRKKHNDVQYMMQTNFPRVKWFFQHGPGKNLFQWTKEEHTASGYLKKYTVIRHERKP